jgi:hypothetical protein
MSDTPWDVVDKMVREFRGTQQALDAKATDIAYLLRNRLRCVNSQATLAAFKKELQNFDSRTGNWKAG